MSAGTDLAEREDLTPEVLAIMQQQEEDLGEVTLQVPILKLAQALTKEVKEGDAEPGDFVNTLTGESYGDAVDFVVAYYQRGRSATTPDGRYLVSINDDLIPATWADLVGEEFVGTRFDEHPDADEKYRERVNRKEIEWGKGPLISTTYNYTGLIVGEEDEPMPARISFKRATKSAHDKIQTLRAARLRGKPFWDAVFTLSSASKSYGRNDTFIVNVKESRATDITEKQQATELALAVTGGRAVDNSASAEANEQREAPDAVGGLEV